MGTFLKVVGVIALLWFGVVAIGCTMMLSAVSHGRPKNAFESGTGWGSGTSSQSARNRNDIIDAMREDRIDFTQLPSGLRVAPRVTVTLTDGTTRTLGNSLADRLVRSLLAARVESRNGPPMLASASYGSQYDDREEDYANRPHFKPGEPMLDPTPAGDR